MLKIESSRTSLRRLRESDFDSMRRLEADPEVMKYTSMRVVQTPEQTLLRLQGHLSRIESLEPYGIWVVERKGTNDFVGWIMLVPTDLEFPEIGFMLPRYLWGQGYTSEFSQALITHAFQNIGATGISARTDVRNTASIHVLRKLGFELIREIQSIDKILGTESHLKVFALKRP